MVDHKIEITDAIGLSEKVDSETKPTKEQVETVEKSMVLFLLDLQKTLMKAKEIVDKIGFTHLGVTLQSSITDIDVYLKQYKIDKEARKDESK